MNTKCKKETMATKGKEEVLNTITLFNTIGQEVEDILAANNIDKSEFLRFMGWEGKDIQSIKKISSHNLKEIESFMGITGLSEYLSTFQQQYKETAEKASESFKKNKKIFQSLKPMLTLLRDDFNEGIDLLADISDFFGVEDESTILNIAETNIARFRAAGFEPDTINLFAWLKRGLIDFEQIQLPPYNREALISWVNQREWKDYLNNREYFLGLSSIFHEFGIGLILTPYLHKTVYGAVRWIDHRPLIQISDREKNLATCWYTLFHEIGHVLLHENDDICEGSLIESKRKSTRKEREATSFASLHLFNGDAMRKYVFDYQNKSVETSFINETSESFSVNKMFVAYWMLKARVLNREYSSLMPEMSFTGK
jgi:HTH-type transcriptional regulator / antitoxin HigA